MDYRRLVSSSRVAFKVNDHVIECGNTTWQIRNIAATTINKRTVPVNEPEPVLAASKPELDLKLGAMLGTATVVFFIGLALANSTLAWIATIVTLGVFTYLRVRAFKPMLAQWKAHHAEIQRRWNVWNKMRQSPPVVYSLMLETNAGSKPLFYSFEEAQIRTTRDAIRRAMERKETGEIAFNIETLNLGSEESMNNFGSQIYQQSIADFNHVNQ